MGLFSAFIVGPCVAPPLAGALLYISQTGDAKLGGLALFALSIGMGTPLLIIGASAGRLLPKAGAWMNAIKAIFGVIMLGMAILLLERVLDPVVTALLWGTLLICTSVYMGILQSQPANEFPNWLTLWKGLGLVMLIYGIMLLVGVGIGNDNIFKPLDGISITANKTTAPNLQFQPITTDAELDVALAKAVVQSKPVILEFYANWCVSCKELEKYTFSDPNLQQVLANFVLLRVDVTSNTAANKALLYGRFQLTGPPVIIFYAKNGQELRNLRTVGFISAADLLAKVQTAMQ